MISPSSNDGVELMQSGYRNVLITEQDQRNGRDSSYREGYQMQILAKNFHILEEFLQTFKTDNLQKQIADLASSTDFKQQWQNKRKQRYHLKYSYFFRQNFWYLLFSIVLLISQIVLLWFLSVFRVFGYVENRSIFILCLTIQVLDMVLKSGYLLISKLKQQNLGLFQIKTKDWIQIYLGNFYCIIYSLLGLSSAIDSVTNQSLIVLDIAAIVFICQRLEDIGNQIKMIKSSLQFKNYVKLFNLMSTLIMIIHSFAVLMYFSTNFTQYNYLSDVQLHEERTWITVYIYSFYFSGTTVLTVGYGDILPKNIIEIFIVLLMQIFGVVMIVYLNGQVGNILCSLRREKQNLQNDLSVLERLKSNFKLSLETTQKIRQFLIDNRRADEENNVHEENALLAKISSGLRQQATLTNHINIIKQSLFLLSNFSAKAHILISNKLINHIYSPNENINQVVGRQKLIFIKKGEICFYVSKKDSQNQNARKIVKSIVISNKGKSDCNCFGYVSLIMGKPNRLKIFSKDFSNCYSVEKAHFLEAISCDNKDFEKYHEMRQSYMVDQNPQQNEAHLFFSEKDHYVCENVRIIGDYLKQHHHSKKKTMLRNYKRRKLIIEVTGGDGNPSQTQSESQIQSLPPLDLKLNKTDSNLNSCLSVKERNKKYQEINKVDMNSPISNLVVQRKYAKRYCKNAYTKKRTEELKVSGKNLDQNKLKYSDPFQVGSSFAYFYTDFNLDMVMRKVNYYTQVLSIFTNMFEQTLNRVNKNKEVSLTIGDLGSNSTCNIEKYRRQKDFLDTINIKL